MSLVPCEVFIRGLEFQKLTQNGVLQSVQLVTAKEWIQLRIHHTPYSLQRWAPALFSRFRAREREAKIRARKREEKRARKKQKRRARKKKSANSRFFLNPKWKSGFRAQSRSAGGKAKVLSEMYSSVC